MNARCNNESLLLFDKLPRLPLLDVCKHLNPSSLLLNSLLSEKWEALVKKDRMRVESEWEIRIKEDLVDMRFKFEDQTSNFCICFKEDPDLIEDFKVEINQESSVISCYHKTTAHLESCCFKAVQLADFLFQPTTRPDPDPILARSIAGYTKILVILGSRSPDFPFRFLSQLPRGTAGFVGLHADQEVDGADLAKFLRNVRMVRTRCRTGGNRFDVSVQIKNLVKCEELSYECLFARVADARFLSIEFVKQLRIKTCELRNNNFTSQNFNEFLRAWMEEENPYRIEKATFYIRKDQNIKIEEVMAGLNPHVGTPRIRDRWMLEYNLRDPTLYPTAIDLAEGWDIRNRRGHVGTVLLELNQLTFFIWASPFNLENYLNSANDSIGRCTQYMEYVNRAKERLQRKKAAGKMELFPDQQKLLENYTETMRRERNRLTRIVDIKEKLLTIWKNDEILYTPDPRNDFLRDPYTIVKVLLVGSADVALHEIPLALQFSRHESSYRKWKRDYEATRQIYIIPITDIASINRNIVYSSLAIIYAFSDSDSFNHLKTLFQCMQNSCEESHPVNQVKSLLVHWPGKDKDQPDQADVESFQRSSWSDIFEFDPNSPLDITTEHSDFTLFSRRTYDYF